LFHEIGKVFADLKFDELSWSAEELAYLTRL